MRTIVILNGFFAMLVLFLSAIATDHTSIILLSVLLGLISVFLFFFVTVFSRASIKVWKLSISLLFSLVFIASVAATGWPLVIRFSASQQSIASTVQMVKQGQMINTPIRIGYFTITKIETFDGTVCLWTQTLGDKEGLVNTSRTGIRRFNVWSTLFLAKDWQFLWED